MVGVQALDSSSSQLLRKAASLLERLADRFGVPERSRILAVANPVSVLPRVVRSHRASLVVMGAVSRGAIRRMFIRGFKTNVTSRQRASSNA